MIESVLTNPIFAFIVLVGLVVFFHEWGHFIVGRLLGVAVEEFSIGFGPTAYSFKKNGTEYKICWLPLGGYVRFYGAEIDGVIPAARREESILTTALYKRSLISIAGPAANFLLSFLIMVVLSGTGMPMPSARVAVMAGKPAAAAGLQSGDRVVAVDGVPVRSWKDLSEKIAAEPGVPLNFSVERPGHSGTMSLTITPEGEDSESAFGEKIRVGRIGVTQFFPTPRLVRQGGGFEGAWGVQTGDTVTAVGGTQVTYLHDLFGALDALSGGSGPQAFAKAVQQWAASGRLLDEVPEWTVRRGDANVALEIDPQALGLWAQALPSDTLMHWDEIFLTSDLLVAGSSPASGWQESCGLVPGVGIRGAGETVRTMASPIDLSLLLRQLTPESVPMPPTPLGQDKLLGSVGVPLRLVLADGSLVDRVCQVPLHLKRDSLNRERPEMAFGVRFETSGLPMEQVIVRSSSWWHAPSDAVAAVGEQAATIFVGLKKLVSGSIPLANLGGPIQIARVAGSAAEGGLLIFFLTVSWMSINIGMFNLLPLPALDGGALLMQGVEAAYGRPLPLTVQHMVQRLGVALILALIVLVFYNDILRLLGG